jgi:hypothetical protein
MNAITDWGNAMLTSLTTAMALFFSAIPKILGFVVILIVGWIVSSLIAKAVDALLNAVKFNSVAERSGFSGFVHAMGIKSDTASFLGNIAKWFVRLIALVVAFDALGLPAVSDVLRQFLLWLPNLVVALVVLVIAGVLANALSGIVRGATAEAGFRNPEFLANVARIGVWAFAIVVAVNQIGIAATLVNTLFMAFVGALALATGLAFGLGGRDTAGEIVREWRTRSQNAAPKLQRAAQAANEEAAQHMPPSLSQPGRRPG